jgi:primosomal protein N''
MTNKERRNKKSIAAEVIYSEKVNKIYAYIQEIKEEITNVKGKKTDPSKLLKKIDLLGEELMKQDIRVATATGLIEKHPYPTCCEAERQRLEEVNKEIENRVNSKKFPH